MTERPAPDRRPFSVDDLLRPAVERRFRRLPRLVGRAVGLCWRAAPRSLVISAGLQLLAGAGLAGQLLVGRRVLAAVLDTRAGGGFATAVPYLVLLGGVSLVVSVADLARAEQQRLLSERVGRHAAREVIEVATAVELVAFEHPEFSDRLQRAQVSAQIRPVQVVSGLLGVLGGLFAIGGIGAALLVLEPLFLGLVLVAFVPAWLAANRGSRLLYDLAVRQTEQDRHRSYLFGLLTRREEAAEVRSFGLAAFLRGEHDRLYDQRIAALGRVIRLRLRLGLAGQLLTTALTTGALSVLAWLVTTGRMSEASAGAAAAAVILLTGRLRGLAGGANSLYESSLFLEDFTGFVDARPGLAAWRSSSTPAPDRFSRLVVSGVSFTYPSRPEPSVRDVSMEIGAEQVVALVGENGSGKTTLAKLLAGLYPPDEGSIRWDGVPVDHCDADQLRSSVAVVFQDFVKYQLTAGLNIGLGRPQCRDDARRIETAARAAGAHDFISGLEEGYQTRLGPQFLGGSDLSIGQWQRVALARAFFRDCPFVILDEPTAALDPRAERELFEDIRSIFCGRSVLIISHRFANVRSADRIYVLSGGQVVEEGTHDELMVRAGLYADLFTLQASRYVDGPLSG